VVLVALQRVWLLLGMVTGITGSLAIPGIMSRIPSLQNWASLHSLNLEVSIGFALVFIVGMIGCLLGTFLTPPEEDEVLMDFYRRVRPWGFWGPIKAKVMAQDPTFQPNPDFLRDMFNIVVGVVWQVALVALPIYIVLRTNVPAIWYCLTAIVVTSVILKFNWYDRLEREKSGCRQRRRRLYRPNSYAARPKMRGANIHEMRDGAVPCRHVRSGPGIERRDIGKSALSPPVSNTSLVGSPDAVKRAEAQCHLVFGTSRVLHKWWGGPPGRGALWARTPSSRSFLEESGDCHDRGAGQGAGCGRGRPPTIDARCRNWEN